ncbi:hypothetical protein L6164_007749 [Bauhinia variegata]|uniref:Uncharacterized protein n=1 Tax=Bauhinia variegata TaxID=167791 RepID=A0ACB9PEP6_BAUVA|nr:hypothetical protein L6164_007749 [Bauhinia variegata]
MTARELDLSRENDESTAVGFLCDAKLEKQIKLQSVGLNNTTSLYEISGLPNSDPSECSTAAGIVKLVA